MPNTSRWRHALTAHPVALDVLLAVLVYAGAVLAPLLGVRRPDPGDTYPVTMPLSGWTVVLGLALCAGLAVRRRWPIRVLAFSVAAECLELVVGRERSALLAVPVIALYTVAATTDRRTAWRAGVSTGVLLTAAAVAMSWPDWLNGSNLGVLAWAGTATAIGDAWRTRRAYVAEVEARARNAELTREQEARRRVVEERLRIARELHDVLAHHIALINVQAGVASHLLDSEPERSRAALAHIQHASRGALDGLRSTVGLLRQAGEPAAPTEPAPGVGQLDELVASFEAAGLRVRMDAEAIGGDLPAAVDLTVYRVVQEALTNVRKHAGPAHTTVRLRRDRTELRLDVSDDGRGGVGAGPAGEGTGHGIIGMRERVAAVGGRLLAGPDAAGGFRVSAWLPLAGVGG